MIDPRLRQLARQDAEAAAAGYPTGTGWRPSYIRRLTEMVERTGDHDAERVLDRLIEVSQAIRIARDEREELHQALRAWESEVAWIETVRGCPAPEGGHQ